jgi:hypothetical protein
VTVIGVWNRVRQFALLFRVTPLEVSTETGRSLERNRRAALTALAPASDKAITLLSTLVSVPRTLSYLGAERYGLWLTVSSLILST